MLDCLKPLTHKRLIEHELEGFGIRLNKTPPKITFKKKDKGGIAFSSNVKEPKVWEHVGRALLLSKSGVQTCKQDV